MSAAACVLAATSASPWASARPPRPPTRVDAVAQVQALAKAMYPSLAGQKLRTRLASDLYFDTEPLPLTAFRYSIASGSEESPRVLLVVSVPQLDDDGKIDLCNVAGDFVNTARYGEIFLRLNEHEDWSEAQDTQALREAGAEFGPWNRAGFLAQTLPRLHALGPNWGRMAAWTAEFEGRYREGGHAAPRVLWRVEVTLRSTRDTRRYRLTFEPFEGKLIHLMRSK